MINGELEGYMWGGAPSPLLQFLYVIRLLIPKRHSALFTLTDKIK